MINRILNNSIALGKKEQEMEKGFLEIRKSVVWEIIFNHLMDADLEEVLEMEILRYEFDMSIDK